MSNKSLWVDSKYGGSNFLLSRNIQGSISWKVRKEDKNYLARFMDTDLGSWDEAEDAKNAVEKRAKRELEFAINRLNSMPLSE